MEAARPNLYDFTSAGLGDWLGAQGFSPYHRDQVWSALYRDLAPDPGHLNRAVREDVAHQLRARSHLGVLGVHRAQHSQDGLTHKFLLRLPDGKAVETVLMRFRGRSTACLSTQAGCAMGCVFCATGQMGLQRHLSPGEIVAQVVHVTRVLSAEGERLRNLVLMGMGEPLHNYDAVMQAVDILIDPRGLAIGPRFITLSTVGVVPGIRRLADEARPVQLAVSLHGATDAERNALVPLGRRWGLAELMDACREYTARRRRRIFFEWALISGKNDRPEQAHALGALLRGMEAHVNLIPLNPTAGFGGKPTDGASARAFQDVLRTHGLPSTVRQRRGMDIDAGCGQLQANERT